MLRTALLSVFSKPRTLFEVCDHSRGKAARCCSSSSEKASVRAFAVQPQRREKGMSSQRLQPGREPRVACISSLLNPWDGCAS